MRGSRPKQVRSAQRLRQAIPMLAALALSPVVPAAARGPADPQADMVAKARLLYNQQQYEAAIEAAEKARAVPASADAARLVLARARLERFRQSADAQDLA